MSALAAIGRIFASGGLVRVQHGKDRDLSTRREVEPHGRVWAGTPVPFFDLADERDRPTCPHRKFCLRHAGCDSEGFNGVYFFFLCFHGTNFNTRINPMSRKYFNRTAKKPLTLHLRLANIGSDRGGGLPPQIKILEITNQGRCNMEGRPVNSGKLMAPETPQPIIEHVQSPGASAPIPATLVKHTRRAKPMGY